MAFDEIILALIVGSTLLGGLLLLTYCAMHVQAYKFHLQRLAEEKSPRKPLASASHSETPVEVS